MHFDCYHFKWSVLVSLTSNEQKKEAISPASDYFLKVKYRQGKTDMNEHNHAYYAGAMEQVW